MSATEIAHRLLLASGNPGKLREYEMLVAGRVLELRLLPGFTALPEFPEDAPTFAENAAGKAVYYSKHSEELIFADDSGLVVPALGGAPGVLSARYAGPGATSEQRNAKLLHQLQMEACGERTAYFLCVIALALRGRCLAVLSGKADGEILAQPRGHGGFGYDPVFFLPELGKSFAELDVEEKNKYSHRGKAFRRLMEVLESQVR